MIRRLLIWKKVVKANNENLVMWVWIGWLVVPLGFIFQSTIIFCSLYVHFLIEFLEKLVASKCDGNRNIFHLSVTMCHPENEKNRTTESTSYDNAMRNSGEFLFYDRFPFDNALSTSLITWLAFLFNPKVTPVSIVSNYKHSC